ncbi:MAG: hypothetical protein ACKORA_06875, partial [Solirubrobacterales bacterium]
MKLTVVGKAPAWEVEGGACSSYLVCVGDTSILLGNQVGTACPAFVLTGRGLADHGQLHARTLRPTDRGPLPGD